MNIFYSILSLRNRIWLLPSLSTLFSPPGADVMIPLYHVLRWFSSRWHQGRAYSMIYRRSGSLAVVWFGFLPTSSTSLPSVSSTSDTQEDRERETTCWQEEGKGRGRSQIVRPQESLVLYKSFNTLCIRVSILGWGGRWWGRGHFKLTVSDRCL